MWDISRLGSWVPPLTGRGIVSVPGHLLLPPPVCSCVQWVHKAADEFRIADCVQTLGGPAARKLLLIMVSGTPVHDGLKLSPEYTLGGTLALGPFYARWATSKPLTARSTPSNIAVSASPCSLSTGLHCIGDC